MLKGQTHTLTKKSILLFYPLSILKGIEKATPWTHTQFNNSHKENQGQSIAHQTAKRCKLFRTCYYKITWRSCKYGRSVSCSCHLWFKRCILSWPFNRLSGHFCLLCMNCQAVLQIDLMHIKLWEYLVQGTARKGTSTKLNDKCGGSGDRSRGT